MKIMRGLVQLASKNHQIRLWCGHSLIIIFLKKKSYKEVLFFSAGRIVCLLGLRPLEASKLPVLFRRKITFGGAGLVMTSSLIGRKTCRRKKKNINIKNKYIINQTNDRDDLFSD